MSRILLANGDDIVGQVRVKSLEELKDPKTLKEFTKPQRKPYTTIEKLIIRTALATLQVKKMKLSDLDVLLSVLGTCNIKMTIAEAKRKLAE